MLVLSRREGEQIKIGSLITVEVVRVSPSGRVRIGIKCPDYIRVLRGEIEAREENKQDYPVSRIVRTDGAEEDWSDVEEIKDEAEGMRIIWRWFLPNRKKCLPHHPPVFVNSSPPIHPPVVCHLSVSADVKALP